MASTEDYELVNYTVTYNGEDSMYAFDAHVSIVTGSDEFVGPAFVTLPDEFGEAELFTGDSLTGSRAFFVRNGASVTIRVTLDDEEDFFVSTQ